MTMKCPCCGGPSLADDNLCVDLHTNTASYGGKSVELHPNKMAEVVYSIAGAWPKTASYVDLSLAVWGALDEPMEWRNNLRVYVSLARKALAELGLSIVVVPGRGYRLEKIVRGHKDRLAA